MPASLTSHELKLIIDGVAGTVITGFDGDLGKVEHLKYDITNLAHYIRKDADVFVAGVGGGRDILSALVFHQKSVTGAEINESIQTALNGEFGDFSGHLDRLPQVTFANDEARAYLSRSQKKFGIIMISLVDTFAANTAGAFALMENAIYTKEGFGIFLRHLNESGILSVSRCYVDGAPFEINRLVSLAVSSLKDLGVQNPRNHILVFKKQRLGGTFDFPSVGTVLIGKREFSSSDIATLNEISKRMDFQVMLSPDVAQDPVLLKLTLPPGNIPDEATIWRNAPTDDRPFFFQFEQAPRILSGHIEGPLSLLFSVLLVTAFFALCFILLPLRLRRVSSNDSSGHLTFYFSCIGMGYLLIEIAQIQWLYFYLGPPVYSLSVTLFTLLLASGVGSYSTDRSRFEKHNMRFLILLVLLVIFGFFTPRMIHFDALSLPFRILCAVGTVAPLGYLMGIMLPLGLKMAASLDQSVQAWLWGVNGACSILASVLATTISVSMGISYAYWLGALCYLAAIMTANRIQRSGKYRISKPAPIR